MWNTELWGKRYKKSGRIGRLDYFKSQLFMFAIAAGLFCLSILTLSKVLFCVSFIYMCMYLWLLFCLTAKRLHDIGLSSWVLLGFLLLAGTFTHSSAEGVRIYSLPGLLFGDIAGYYISQGISVVLLLILFGLKGTKRDNKYGKSLIKEEA